jgi:hypothetical protein
MAQNQPQNSPQPNHPPLDPEPYQPSSLAKQFAEEHHKFLKENNPKLLAQLVQSGDLAEHLREIGESGEQMLEHEVEKLDNSPRVQNLPFMERVRELQSLQRSMMEIIRHDLIFQPIPEED